MSQYQVFVQTYKGNQICDLLKATFYSLDDALAYRDWQASVSPMLVAYLRVDPEPEEESVLERAKRAYGLAESEEERKRRQRRDIMRRYRAKKRAQKEKQMECVSIVPDSNGNAVVLYKETNK